MPGTNYQNSQESNLHDQQSAEASSDGHEQEIPTFSQRGAWSSTPARDSILGDEEWPTLATATLAAASQERGRRRHLRRQQPNQQAGQRQQPNQQSGQRPERTVPLGLSREQTNAIPCTQINQQQVNCGLTCNICLEEFTLEETTSKLP